MENKSVYDNVIEVVNAASDKYAGSLIINESKHKRLGRICEIIEELIIEFDCESFEVTVDEMMDSLIIGIECEELEILEGRSHVFYELISLVDSFRFSRAKKDVLRTEFTLTNMWTRI